MPPGERDVAAPAVATLTAERDAIWAEGDLAPGSVLRVDDRFTLTDGLAEITTQRGTVVILEGPATIELVDSPNALRLQAGKLIGICETPSSKGFLVYTKHAEVTDIGTRFGVEVQPSGETRLVVFSGEASIAPVVNGRVEPATSVFPGQAASVKDDKLALVPAPEHPSESRFARGIAFDQQRAKVRTPVSPLDDRLIVYYAFDRAGGRVLRESRSQSQFDAEIVGARWVEGRKPGQNALDFTGKAWEERVVLSKAASDQLNLESAFTMAVWIKIGSVSEVNWSAIIAKGNDAWRVMARHDREAGKDVLGFYRSKSKDLPEMVFAKVTTTKFQTNRWHHLVVTGTPEGQEVLTRLYIDGEMQDEARFPKGFNNKWQVSFGANETDKQNSTFDGQLGEVAFYSQTISAEEVRRLFQASSSGSGP